MSRHVLMHIIHAAEEAGPGHPALPALCVAIAHGQVLLCAESPQVRFQGMMKLIDIESCDMSFDA